MKAKNFKIFMQAILLLGIFTLFTFNSCKKDDDLDKTTASFQYQINPEDFLEVIFTNYSKNATSFSWDFGDSQTSTEENPVHKYASAGNYEVALTASNEAGQSHIFKTNITITDPDVALTLLSGSTSKTWKLYRVGTSMGVGPPDNLRGWFALENDGSRPCVYSQEFTFTRDGSYIFDDKGSFWGEGGIFPADMVGTCFEAIAANMKDKDGNDVSAWLGGTHSFVYTPSTGMVTLTGLGAWIGLVKVGTTGEVGEPQVSVSFKIEIEEFDGYDLMHVIFDYGWGVWDFTYASYSNPSLEPDVVSFFVDFGFEIDGFTVTFENRSKDAVSYSWDFGDGNTSTEENPTHTYDAEDIYEVVLTGTNATGDTKEAKKNVSISLDPTEPAPTPTEPEANVISIFSDTYTNITGVNTNPGWGQATVTTIIEVVEGDEIIKMAGLNYQGIDFADNAQDVSGKTKLHLDIYCSVVTDILIFVISPGKESPVTITTEAGVWKSIDIDLSEYTVPNLAEVIQFKFEATGSPTIFVDNIYFY